MKTSTLASLLLCLTTAGACQSGGAGTPTRLADLVKTRLNVRAEPGPPSAPSRPPSLPRIEAEVSFEDAGAVDESGLRCPVLLDRASATIDGKPATFIERGGPVGQGAGKIEYYVCRPIRFVAALAPPFDRQVVISLADGTRAFRVEIDRLLDARGAVLPVPAEGKSPRVVGCTGGLACNVGPADPATVVFND